jgi:hypothetical protein
VTDVDDPAEIAGEAGASSAERSRRWAGWTFVALVAVTGPLLLFVLGRDRWFARDDWDFLSDRRLTNVGDLFRPHNNEHWSTLPIAAYRVMYAFVGLHSYRAYQVMIVALHLVAVVLLRLVMRRAGVGPWTATITAALLLLFGPGQEDIVWSFQIGFVGALVLGLVQLLLADHDGAWDRRDWLGLVAGAGALMCSGVGVAMVLVVGLSTLLRRGWRVAAGHVVPLAAMYLTWWQLEGRPAGVGPSAPLGHVLNQVARWDIVGTGATFEAIGHYTVVGVLIGVVLVVGLGLAVRIHGRDFVCGRGAPVLALLVGGLAFMTVSAFGRWYFGPEYVRASRYLYMTAAMVLPGLGVAVWEIGRRWAPALPMLLVLLLVGVPANIVEFGNGQYTGRSWVDNGELVAALPASKLARELPPDYQPLPRFDPGLTIGWLLEATETGDLTARRELPAHLAGQVRLVLGFTREDSSTGPPLRRCQSAHTVRVDPVDGSRVRIGSGRVAIVARDPATQVWSAPVVYDTSLFGDVFHARTTQLHLRVNATRGQTVTVCT